MNYYFTDNSSNGETVRYYPHRKLVKGHGSERLLVIPKDVVELLNAADVKEVTLVFYPRTRQLCVRFPPNTNPF